MRRRTFLLASGLFLLASCSDSESPAAPEPVSPDADAALAQGVPGSMSGERVRVIVRLSSQGAEQAVLARAQGLGATVMRRYDRFPLLALEIPAQALQGLERAQGVVSVWEDEQFAPALANSLPVINADQVHALGWRGGGLTVAILDTGIDNGHPFFAGRVVEEACFSSDGTDQTSLCPDGSTEQTGAGAASINIAPCIVGGSNICDHGPHVAGIAAGDGDGIPGAPPAGVAPDADIIAIQVFTRRDLDENCGGDPGDAPCLRAFNSDLIAGLEHVLDLDPLYTIASANMSLGGGENSSACDGNPLKDAVDDLRAANVATVVAAGNDGFGDGISSPACISTAIAVGATDNSDNVAGFSNRGPLLDLFAPGVSNRSAVANDGFGFKSGTSMATPHVAGAWAVLRQVFPGMSVPDVLTLLQDTGVPITYLSDGSSVTTPRIDLLAAIQADSDPPELTVDEAVVTVDEGSVAANSGTFSDPDGEPVTLSASFGTVIDEGGGVWAWSFQTTDGPAESQVVTITGTDDKGLEGEVTFDLVVENVDPTVTIDAAQITVVDEGESLAVTAHFSDPGVLDAPFTAAIECYDIDGFGSLEVAGTVEVTDATPPLLEGTVTGSCPYGDTSQSGDPPSGTFTVTVTVTDKDGGEGSASFDATVHNVDPTVEIDVDGALVINGIPTFVAQIGDPLDFSAQVTDPGSDDLFITWDWGDGTTDLATYLVNPPTPDPFPSPDMDPRDVTDLQSHAWSDACMYGIVLTAVDDDGGQGDDGATVLIAGTSGQARGVGWWMTQYRGNRSALGAETLACYLQIVEHMSAVFDEEREGTSSNAAATDVLFVAGNNGEMTELLDQQLLAAWLNFANGAFGLDDLVDTTGDGVPDTSFSDAILTAESVRLDPGATDAELEEQKEILEAINLMHGG